MKRVTTFDVEDVGLALFEYAEKRGIPVPNDLKQGVFEDIRYEGDGDAFTLEIDITQPEPKTSKKKGQ